MAKKFLTSIDLCGNQLIRPIIENVYPNPINDKAKGRLAFNTSENSLIVYDGEDWKKLQYEIQPGTYMEVDTYPNLKAIEKLTNANGLLKKTGENTWEIDTNKYLLSTGNALSASRLETPRYFSITGGATAEGVSFNGSAAVALNVTALDASNLTSTIPSEVLGRSTLHIGTTPIELNRPLGELALTGIASIELDNKAIIKYDKDKEAIYIGKASGGGAIDLYTDGEITSSNRLDEWVHYDKSKTNWVLSAKLGHELKADLINKSNIGHNHNLSDLLEKDYNSLTNTPTLGTVAEKNVGTASGEIPILGTDGKLNDIVIPKIAISDTFIIDTPEAMLALTAEIGDIAIRTDVSKSFILKSNDAKSLDNWQELLTPTSSVQSVAGKTGVVVLSKGDVSLGNVDNTSDANKPVSTAQASALELKVDKIAGMGLSTNDYTTDEKTKLDGIEAGANKYTHPDNHPASFIVESKDKRFVSDTEKTTWNKKETPLGAQDKATKALDDAKLYTDENLIEIEEVVAFTLNEHNERLINKVDKVTGKGLSTNDYTTAEKNKLSGIAINANNYIHPDKHEPSEINTNANNRFVTDAEKGVWNAKETPDSAQEKADGALSSAKAYVDGKVKTDVPENALFIDTVYTHPETHPASIIDESDDRQFVTKAQKEAWSGNEQTIPTGTNDQYFRGDKSWQTLDTTVVTEGKNLYYTNERVKEYGDTLYLVKDGTALKAQELKTARNFSIAGTTGLSAIAIPFKGSDNVSLNLTGSLNVANGGTGLTDAKGGFTRKVTGNLTSSATSYAITHGLGTDVIVQVIEKSTNEVVECDIIMTSVNVATIMFNKAPIADTYRYIIIG